MYRNNTHDKSISDVKALNEYKDNCVKYAFVFESFHYSLWRWDLRSVKNTKEANLLNYDKDFNV